MPEAAPPSLAWVPAFVESANRALDGDVVAAVLEPRTDPLQWVLVLTSAGGWLPETVRGLRQLLKSWAQVNDAEYARSDYDRRTLCALIVLRGLGPERNVNPFVEDRDVQNREARRLDRRPKVRK